MRCIYAIKRAAPTKPPCKNSYERMNLEHINNAVMTVEAVFRVDLHLFFEGMWNSCMKRGGGGIAA